MGRVLCIDYGRRRVGLAVSDALGRTAQPLEVLERTKRGSVMDAVLEAVQRVEATEIVVGLPLRLDGSAGVAADAARQFATALEERAGVPVVLWDERLSTAQASRDMRSAGMSARKQRGVVDKVAAAVILRSYLESRNPEAAIPEDAVLPIPPSDVEDRRPGAAEKPPPSPRSRSAKGREKRNRHSSDRRGWKQDLEDL